MSEQLEETRIFINDAQARALLDVIAGFDAAQPEGFGKINLTRSAKLAFQARLNQIKLSPEGRRFLRQYEAERSVGQGNTPAAGG